jgi:hypothetical protein
MVSPVANRAPTVAEVVMYAHRLVRSLAVTVPLLVLVACNPFRRESAVQMSADDPALNTRWHANLASPSALAGVVQMNGSASMAPNTTGPGTVVTLALANAAPGGVHPWEMRRGQCGTMPDGGSFGTADSYQPLEVGSDGRATASTTIPTETPQAGRRYYVVVHASKLNAMTVVACGNLAPPTR